MRRFLPALLLALLGGALAAVLATRELAVVRDHLIGFPDADASAHHLRPVVLILLCLVPALAALYYGLADALDRYLIRSFLSAFALCFSALLAIWLIGDLTEHLADFRESGDTLSLMGRYYSAAFPKFFVDFAPFGLLLAMLYSLGKLSRGQEIVSIIQTGRGVTRLIFPLITMGFIVSLICLGFNFRWAPSAAGYLDAILDEAKMGSLSKARDVVYFNADDKRLWFIGSFPYDYHHGQPLRHVIVRSFSDDGKPTQRLQATRARWNRQTNEWTFYEVTRWDLTHRLETPEALDELFRSFWEAGDGAHRPDLRGAPLDPQKTIALPDPLTIKGWSETPWQLVKPGLKAEQLGIPGLRSWLLQNEESAWGNKRRFLTQWHYRWAQPGICLAIVLLAAPLGIVFSRRGAAGGIALAIFLCAGMLFSSTVFLSLGESGYIAPVWAAWGTNLLASGVALVLIQRRLAGRPIYQTLRKLLPV